MEDYGFLVVQHVAEQQRVVLRCCAMLSVVLPFHTCPCNKKSVRGILVLGEQDTLRTVPVANLVLYKQ